MSNNQNSPQGSEDQVEELRQKLNQQDVDKQGDQRTADDAGEMPMSHFGAVEDDASGESDQVTVITPTTGPIDVVEDSDTEGDEVIDPAEEIQGG